MKNVITICFLQTINKKELYWFLFQVVIKSRGNTTDKQLGKSLFQKTVTTKAGFGDQPVIDELDIVIFFSCSYYFSVPAGEVKTWAGILFVKK